MKAKTLLLAAILICATSCTEKKKAHEAYVEEEEEPLPERYENDDLPKAADELFDDFVYYFASNERLQRRRISFPLTMHNGKDTAHIEESQWLMDSLFMKPGLYTIIFDKPEQRELVNDTTIDKVTVEKIFFSADSVAQYLFNRNQGRWMLTDVVLQQLGTNANAQFLKFYRDFAADSLFQQKSLDSEIAFTGPDPDDDFARMEGFISPDTWEAFAPELPRDTIYNIVYEAPASLSREKTFVVCGISNGLETELTFKQKRGKWKLTKLTE
jgi:hypothetical protein